MASRTRVFLLAFATLSFIVATVPLATVRAQEYSVSFTVSGLPAGVGTHYYVDNAFNGTILAGETKSLNFAAGGVHTLSVDLNVNVGNGTRHQCRDNLWSFAEAGTHTFIYKTQYHLEVISPYGSPLGTDWYDEGVTTYARLATNVTAGPEGVRYVFVSWQGDASGQGLVSDPIVMDRARKAVAGWKTQYSLRVSSDPTSIFAPLTLWYDEGFLADFGAPHGTNGTDTRYVFGQWGGDYSGADVRASLQMDRPKSITAKYNAQYLLTVSLRPPEVAQSAGMPKSGWYDQGQIAKLGPVPQNITVSSTERLRLMSWNLDGMTQPGTSMEVPMEGPHRVELIYRREYYLDVRSQFGEAKGSGWYPSGQKVRFSVTYGGSDFPVKYIFEGWKSSPPAATIGDARKTETDVTMDRPYVIEAEWKADYTPLWAFILAIVSAAILISAVVIVAVKRPGLFGRFTSSLRFRLRGRKIGALGASLARPTSWVVCQKCGARIPSSAEYCQSCGTVGVRDRAAVAPNLEAIDERVYDYIVKRHGEISLSRASTDLGLSVDEVKRSAERLKKKGRLA